MNESPSEIFTNTYNDIVKKLREMTNSDQGTGFYKLLEKAKSRNSLVINMVGSELKEMADLRNTIAHDKSNKRPDLAIPTDYAIKRISEIEELLVNPPKVIPLFRKVVFSLQYNDPISKASKSIYENNYSQIPIYNQKDFIGLLTSNSIARWVGAKEICDLAVSVSNVYDKYTEYKDNYRFISKNTNLFNTLDIFNEFQNKGKRLEAILITDSGKEKESLLGIITIYDLHIIFKKIK